MRRRLLCRARRVAWSSQAQPPNKLSAAPPDLRSLQLVQRASGVDYTVPGRKENFVALKCLAQRLLLLNGALVTATRDSGSTQKDFRQPHLTTNF